MSKLAWYWHRLRAMSVGEMALHARKKLRQAADAKRTSWPEVDLACSGAFPKLASLTRLATLYGFLIVIFDLLYVLL